MTSKKPNLQYIRVSGPSNIPIQIEFNGNNYNLFVGFKFIGTIEEYDIPRWINGFELQHATGWGLY